MSPSQLGILIPIIALMIPVVAIVGGIAAKVVRDMAAHQREMARLMHGTARPGDDALARELTALRGEVAQLRDRLNALTVASDTPGLAERLETGAQD